MHYQGDFPISPVIRGAGVKPTRVLLADDHALVRAGFRSLVEGIKGVRVVAEAKDGREALRLIRQHRPDIALLDIAMPLMNGLDALAQINREFPRVRVVMLSMYEDEEYVHAAKKSGAAGYLLKSAEQAEFQKCVRAVASGQTYFDPQISKGAFSPDAGRGEASVIQADESPFGKLTLRQRQVLQLIAEGHTNREIAGIMEIDVKTVETHRTNLMRRLNIHDVANLTRYALQKGLIRPHAAS